MSYVIAASVVVVAVYLVVKGGGCGPKGGS